MGRKNWDYGKTFEIACFAALVVCILMVAIEVGKLKDRLDAITAHVEVQSNPKEGKR